MTSRASLRLRQGAAGRRVAGFTIATSHFGDATAGRTTWPAPVPPVIHQNDLILFQYVANNTAALTVTPPAAVTETPLIASSLVGANAYFWYWHLVTAGEAATPPASWDFTTSAPAGGGNIMTTRITGHNVATPFDTAVAQVAAASSAYAVAAVTTGTAGCLLVGGANIQSATTQSCAADGSWTQDDSTCTLTLGRGQIAVHQLAGAAGSHGGWTWTQTAALAGEAFNIAVRAA